MGSSRVSSLFVATVLAAGVSAMVSPSAFANGVHDCEKQAEAGGMKSPDAGLACSYAKGGDTEDCASMVKHDSSATDEQAADTCAKAAPAAPAGG